MNQKTTKPAEPVSDVATEVVTPMTFPTTVYRNVDGALHSRLANSEEELKTFEGEWRNNPMDVGIVTHPQSKGVGDEPLTNAHLMTDEEFAAHNDALKAKAASDEAIAKAKPAAPAPASRPAATQRAV